MRVFLTTDAVGGVWDYTATLASELCDAGHAVLVAVVGEAGPARLAQLPPAARVAARAYRLEWMQGAADDVRSAGAWLSTLAREWGADVAHLNQFAYAVHDFGAPTLVVAHSDVLSWFGETLGQAPGPEWAEYEEWVRTGLEAADLVVAPSVYQAELTTRHYGRCVDRVIHNGVRPAPAPPPAARHRLALTAGRAWDEAKGVDVVDKAAALLGESGPPVHLFGPESGSHGERAGARNLVRHGRIPHDELVDWMGHAALYVAASRYEPFGLAPLEAALQGCALVLSDIGSFRELWDGCAAFFPTGDAAALADTLSFLDRAPARRAALARAARERAVAEYSAERFTGGYVEIYGEIVAAAPADAHRLPVV
jgi:glycosyltransferase involved in cell wall biosynthesis